MDNLIDHITISYAGNREDVILSGFFGPNEKGFYVDVGAYDPDEESVTKLFYDRGWSGINIEPQKRYFDRLVKKRRRDTNLNIGVADKASTLTLREYVDGTGLSTFSSSMQQSYSKQAPAAAQKYIDHKVKVKRLEDVFKEQKVTSIQFLKVDVEGFEYEVLMGNNWDKYRPEVVCIEANHIETDWHPLLKKVGYELAFFDGLNEYFVDSQKPERLKQFSYVEAVVFKEPVVTYRMLPILDEYRQLKQQVTELEQAVNAKQEQINRLQKSLGHHLRHPVKSAAKVKNRLFKSSNG